VARLRKTNAVKKRGQIETLPNVGLQLADVVKVTDARAGVSLELYRERAIEEAYDTTKERVIWKRRKEPEGTLPPGGWPGWRVTKGCPGTSGQFSVRSLRL
jgi:hypothetical protein